MLFAGPAQAQVITRDVPAPMQSIAQEDKLGQRVPMDVELIDHTGRTVRLESYFTSGKPVVLALVYYTCPMMCPLMLGRLQEHINQLGFIAGEDFKLVAVSIDFRETPELAASNRQVFLSGYRLKPNAVIESGFNFHVARAGEARRLADAVGFKYSFDAATGQYAHGSTLTILTAEGVVSRYVDGLDPQPNELRLALLEATDGKIARTIGDFFLHFCFRFDASTGKYTMQVMRVMQVGAVATAVALGILVLGLRIGERWRRSARAAGASARPAAFGLEVRA